MENIRSGFHNRRNRAAEKFMLSKAVSVAEQTAALMKKFPESQIKLSGGTLEWIGTLQPSPYSEIYTVKMEYRYLNAPKVSIISPPLKRRNEDPVEPIPHMYDQKYLCLYYPKIEEWRKIDWLHKSIVPWATTWLYYYELWLVTGKWLGGGVEHGSLRMEDMIDSPKRPKHY